MLDEHDNALRPILRRIIASKIDDGGTQQRIDGGALKGDASKNMVRLQHHGFSSNPPVGSEGLALALGGRSDRLWVLGLEDKGSRPTGLPAGGTAIYDASGNIIKIVGEAVTFDFDKAGNGWSAKAQNVTVTASKGQITIEATSDHIVVNPNGSNVYIGGAVGSGSRVLTEGGVSKNVYAEV